VKPWRVVGVLAATTLVAALTQAFGPPAASAVGSAFVPLALALVAVLARLGDELPAARSGALLLVSATVAAVAFASLGFVVFHVVEPATLQRGGGEPVFAGAGEARLGFMVVLLAACCAAVLMALARPVRHAARDIVPIDPERPSHAVALALAVALATIPLLPLFVLGRPPLPLPPAVLPPGTPAVGVPTFAERAMELGWLAPAAVVAAGLWTSRPPAETWRRLGLVRTPAWQLALAAVAGAVLVPILYTLVPALDARAGGPAGGAAGTLAWAFGQPGDLVPGLLAALGIELAVRGLLQPRLGLILSNIVFVAPHAWLAGWNGLFVLFLPGILFGIVRGSAGTTAAIAGHLAFRLVLALGRG
jgi:hypothetical protein